jgi:hypothetical protein
MEKVRTYKCKVKRERSKRGFKKAKRMPYNLGC